MGIFNLKLNDTRPILQVSLKDGNGNPFDLTGATQIKLRIWLSDGSKLSRDMVVYGAATNGVLQYTWIATDWNAVSGGGSVGGLVVGPSLPLAAGLVEHRMEYEVTGAGGALTTFPNDGYDTLRIISDIQ